MEKRKIIRDDGRYVLLYDGRSDNDAAKCDTQAKVATPSEQVKKKNS